MTSKTIKIAIIGSGIGGASCSHFLNELFNDKCEIDVYEKSDRIGGRLATTEYNDHSFEIGGSILHESNIYMNKLREKCNLKKIYHNRIPNTYMGIFDSNQILFSNVQHSFSIFNLIRFALYFGLFQLIKFNRWIDKFIQSFKKIYLLQDNNYTFNSVDEFLNKLNTQFTKMSQTSLSKALNEQRFNSKIVNELSSVATLTNYNQSTNINGFVGLVSLAGTTGNLWSIHNGNRQVPELLIKNNKSILNLKLNTHVTSISGLNDRENLLKYTYDKKEYSCVYDYVIIAFPLTKQTKNDLKLSNLNVDDYYYDDYELQLTKTYLVEAKRISLFDKLPTNKRIELYTCDETSTFRNVAIQYPCDYDQVRDENLWLNANEPKLYKLFSPSYIDVTLFNKIFDNNFKIVHEIDWLAYPKYNQNGTSKFPSICIDTQERSRVLYLNAIEWTSSCMEMSCISGRNIALLIAKREKYICENKFNYGPNKIEMIVDYFLDFLKFYLIDVWFAG